MRNRSNLLVLIGIAFFVVGGIIVFVVTDDDDGGSAAIGETTVVVATHDIPSGAKANEEIENGGLKEVQISAGALVPGAIQSLQQVAGATFIQAFADDQQVIASGLQQLQRGYDLPDGYEAVAVQVNFQQGVAGYVNVGDRINLYGVYPPGLAVDGATVPRAELLLTNVQVLDTSQTIPTNGVQQDASVRATGSDVIFLLALKTADVEKVVFDTSFAEIYASLVTEDAAPAGPTGGESGDTILAVEPNDAAAA